MRQKLFRFLNSGDHFYTKDLHGKIHKWVKLEKCVNANIGKSPTNVVNLKSGKFGLVYDGMAITYPSSFRHNQTPSPDKMSETAVYIY